MPDGLPKPTEVRLLQGAELRAVQEGKERGFTGRLVPYGVPAPIGGRYVEVMAPGVFAKSIREAARALPLLHNHDSAQVIGKAVEWEDRADGLHGHWVMAPTDEARAVFDLIDGGFMTGLSCGFVPLRGQDEWDIRDAPEVSTVTRRQARLVESSTVPTPTWAEAVVLHTRSGQARGALRPRAEAWREWLAQQQQPR
jgi:hypothetical protein